ncbi:hypothetical protein KIKIMORA_05210 [Brevundimonas phage vB_BpoS-Kikimora]|uniref:Uncharacterized protein n=1 Tax=Brevundimonas phage vB_BpoS-Kikimora TaxID=2948601 RepID=A0A9E7SLK5_9CAUD|nr:hypothetical protein KIKIMORA_05210 [Brevundimonas phage vB_BpoS-Kikimora]
MPNPPRPATPKIPLMPEPPVMLLTPAFDRWNDADDLSLAWMTHAAARRRAEETL